MLNSMERIEKPSPLSGLWEQDPERRALNDFFSTWTREQTNGAVVLENIDFLPITEGRLRYIKKQWDKMSGRARVDFIADLLNGRGRTEDMRILEESLTAAPPQASKEKGPDFYHGVVRYSDLPEDIRAADEAAKKHVNPND